MGSGASRVYSITAFGKGADLNVAQKEEPSTQHSNMKTSSEHKLEVVAHDLSMVDPTSTNDSPKSPRSPRFGTKKEDCNKIASPKYLKSPPKSFAMASENKHEHEHEHDQECDDELYRRDEQEADFAAGRDAPNIGDDVDLKGYRGRYFQDVDDEDNCDSYGDDRDESRNLFSELDESNAEMFAVTAMSLGMENDDLLFNLMYFGGDAAAAGADLDNVFNTAMEETVALYSENNTPYKLRPASVDTLNGLEVSILESELGADLKECSVCRDDIEIGDELVRLPLCKHLFHKECIFRWLKLQGWCPVCRTEIAVPGSIQLKHDKQESSTLPAIQEHTDCAIGCLADRFEAAACLESGRREL